MARQAAHNQSITMKPGIYLSLICSMNRLCYGENISVNELGLPSDIFFQIFFIY